MAVSHNRTIHLKQITIEQSTLRSLPHSSGLPHLKDYYLVKTLIVTADSTQSSPWRKSIPDLLGSLDGKQCLQSDQGSPDIWICIVLKSVQDRSCYCLKQNYSIEPYEALYSVEV